MSDFWFVSLARVHTIEPSAVQPPAIYILNRRRQKKREQTIILYEGTFIPGNVSKYSIHSTNTNTEVYKYILPHLPCCVTSDNYVFTGRNSNFGWQLKIYHSNTFFRVGDQKLFSSDLYWTQHKDQQTYFSGQCHLKIFGYCSPVHTHTIFMLWSIQLSVS